MSAINQDMERDLGCDMHAREVTCRFRPRFSAQRRHPAATVDKRAAGSAALLKSKPRVLPSLVVQACGVNLGDQPRDAVCRRMDPRYELAISTSGACATFVQQQSVEDVDLALLLPNPCAATERDRGALHARQPSSTS